MLDYFYSSARVRALETGLLSRDALSRLLEATTLDAAYAMLSELGYTLQTDANGKVLREEMLSERLAQAYAEIAALTEDANTRVFALWRYPYDCNNVKAAIKGFVRGKACDGMMIDLGTVSVADVMATVQTGNFSALPAQMAEAAQEAVSAYAKTQNPQQIDLLLDRACYRDMLDAAEESGVEYAIKLVRTKIDLLNLVMCIRVVRMRYGEGGRTLLQDALLDGGTLSKDLIMELYQTEERRIWERLSYTDYKGFAQAFSSNEPTLTEVERAADDFWMSIVRQARFVSCGAEVLIGYLCGVECEVRNLRVLFAGKAAGLEGETVWERIREGYV